MKKLKSLLPVMLAAGVLFSSCDLIELLTEEETLKPQETFDKTLTIDIPDEYNGKECFLIYTNTGESDSYIGRNAASRSASSNQRMSIYKGVTNMGGGYYRDEVVFNENYVDRTARSAGDSGTETETNNKTYRDLVDNKFYVCINEQTQFEPKEFKQKYNGEHCRIWFWHNNPSVVDIEYLRDSDFKKLGKIIDNVFVDETQIFGSNAYNVSGKIKADENTKLDILIYDLFQDATDDQQTGTFGFFYSNDFNLNPARTQSNMCEAIHIDSFFLTKDIEGTEDEYGNKVPTQRITSTIVHEFQHLLNYCNKSPRYLDSDIWYNEMLSMCAEDIFQNIIGTSDDDSPKSRLNESFNEPYQGFVYWPESNDPDVLNAYGNAYAFGAYLMRNYGGVNLIHEIANNNWANEDSISHALQAVGKNEDFISVLKKFGYVYLLDKRNTITLNKEIKQTFSGTSYKLDKIDLNKYYFQRYSSYNALINDTDNNLYIKEKPQYSYTYDRTLYVLYGPRIFRTSYKLTQPIRQYGFAVYYLGKVDSDQTYEIPNPGNNIEYEIVSFD